MCLYRVHWLCANVLVVKDTLTHPDERQLAKGIQSTGVPAALKSMLDSLVWESTRTEEGCVSIASVCVS